MIQDLSFPWRMKHFRFGRWRGAGPPSRNQRCSIQTANNFQPTNQMKAEGHHWFDL